MNMNLVFWPDLDYPFVSLNLREFQTFYSIGGLLDITNIFIINNIILLLENFSHQVFHWSPNENKIWHKVNF